MHIDALMPYCELMMQLEKLIDEKRTKIFPSARHFHSNFLLLMWMTKFDKQHPTPLQNDALDEPSFVWWEQTSCQKAVVELNRHRDVLPDK